MGYDTYTFHRGKYNRNYLEEPRGKEETIIHEPMKSGVAPPSEGSVQFGIVWTQRNTYSLPFGDCVQLCAFSAKVIVDAICTGSKRTGSRKKVFTMESRDK